jgi:hypothetical protein
MKRSAHEHDVRYLIHGEDYTFCIFPGCDYEESRPVELILKVGPWEISGVRRAADDPLTVDLEKLRAEWRKLVGLVIDALPLEAFINFMMKVLQWIEKKSGNKN